MSAGDGKSPREQWIRRAAELGRQGRFAKYSPKQREEILRKGYLGMWPPDRAIMIAKAEAEKGYAVRKAKFNDNMRDHFDLVGEEVRETVLKLLEEVPPESYDPPAELEEPPGYPFVFRSKTLQREVYFKFQVTGSMRKPQVLFWSCHPPLY